MPSERTRRRLLANIGAAAVGLPAVGTAVTSPTQAATTASRSTQANRTDAIGTVSPTVVASTPPQEGFVFESELPGGIEPTIETAQVKTVTLAGLSDDVVVTDIETDSRLVSDPLASYEEGASELEVVFEFAGAHILEVTIEAQPAAAADIEPYDPRIDTIDVIATDESGATATDSVTLGIRDATSTIGSFASGDSGQIDTGGLRTAINEWRGDEIGTNLLRETIDYWRTRNPVAFVDVADQETDGTELTVEAATYAGHSWGAHVHFFAGGDMGATIGVSEEFEAGEVAENFTIPLDGLDQPLDQEQTLMVMLHTTNQAGGYSNNDAVWVWVDEEPVTDLTFVEPE